MFHSGFVFGKFYPLHAGHVALINFALKYCTHLDVLVCCSNKEAITSKVRADWIREEFSGIAAINIIEFNYDELLLPNTSISDKDVSRIWAAEFKKILPDASLLVTSEPYGDYVAEYMHISHISFDSGRQREAISASLIRQDILDYWDYLPDSVKRYFQKIVVISGTESTGKTELANFLSSVFKSALVEEAGRALAPNSNMFSIDDLHKTASQHALSIQAAKKSLLPLVVVDTDIYITQSYANFVFGETLDIAQDIYEINKPHVRIFLDASVPFVQDGTRLDENDRNKLDFYHRETLNQYGQFFTEISGADWDARRRESLILVARLFDASMFFSV